MSVHVVLLRGINVGGHNRIAMADLRGLLGDLGYRDVATHLQSGNAVVTSGEEGAEAVTATEACTAHEEGLRFARLPDVVARHTDGFVTGRNRRTVLELSEMTRA